MKAAVQQVCSSCGNPALPDGKFCLYCGDVLNEPPENDPTTDASDLRTATQVSGTEPPEYAGFWLRVWAGAIDVGIEVVASLFFSLLVYYSILLFADPSYGLTHATAAYVSGIAAIAFLSVGAWLY